MTDPAPGLLGIARHAATAVVATLLLAALPTGRPHRPTSHPHPCEAPMHHNHPAAPRTSEPAA